MDEVLLAPPPQFLIYSCISKQDVKIPQESICHTSTDVKEIFLASFCAEELVILYFFSNSIASQVQGLLRMFLYNLAAKELLSSVNLAWRHQILHNLNFNILRNALDNKSKLKCIYSLAPNSKDWFPYVSVHFQLSVH